VKPTIALACLLIAVAAVFAPSKGCAIPWPSPAPIDDTTIPTPTVAAQDAVRPITRVLEGHAAQAAELAQYYGTAADDLRRRALDAQGKPIIGDTRTLRTFLERSVTVRFAGRFEPVPGLSDAIHGPDGALGKLLGLDPGELDVERAAAALEAVAWACQEAAR
jgi:hypothetical protein